LSAAHAERRAIPKLAKVLEWRMRRRLAIHGVAEIAPALAHL